MGSLFSTHWKLQHSTCYAYSPSLLWYLLPPSYPDMDILTNREQLCPSRGSTLLTRPPPGGSSTLGSSSVSLPPSRQELRTKLRMILTPPTLMQLHIQLMEMLPGIRTLSLGTTPSTGSPSRTWTRTLTMW